MARGAVVSLAAVAGKTYLTEEHVAQILGISARTLQAWRRTGKGPPFIRLGRLVRYESDSLRQWIETPVVQALVARAKSRAKSTDAAALRNGFEGPQVAKDVADEPDAWWRADERDAWWRDALVAAWRHEVARQLAWLRAWQPAGWRELVGRLERIQRAASWEMLPALWLAVQDVEAALDHELGVWSAKRERAWRPARRVGHGPAWAELAEDERLVLRSVRDGYPLAAALRDLWPASETWERLTRLCIKVGVAMGKGRQMERRLRAVARRLLGAGEGHEVGGSAPEGVGRGARLNR